MPFGFLAPKYFKIIWLSYMLALNLPDEGLFLQKRGVGTKFDIYVFIIFFNIYPT